MPRDWTGPTYIGRRYSDCPAPLLDLLAKLCDYSAQKADEKGEITKTGQPVGPYRRRDAARARGWAARLRSRPPPPAPPPAVEQSEFDDKGVF